MKGIFYLCLPKSVIFTEDRIPDFLAKGCQHHYITMALTLPCVTHNCLTPVLLVNAYLQAAVVLCIVI